jgi:riboflavin biosynthesis pyrimidine reductase
VEIARDRAPADRPFVYVNMIMTVDGRTAVDGRSSALGGEADLETLLELRTLAEGYDRLVRSEDRRERRLALGLAEDPLAVLISRRFDVPWEAGLFQAASQPVLIYTGVEGPVPDVPAPVEVVVLADPSPAVVFADLRARGVLGLLSEGGPTLVGGLLAAGLVDELFVTLTPLLTGDEAEPTVVAGGRLPVPVALTLVSVRQHGSELFLRYAV